MVNNSDKTASLDARSGILALACLVLLWLVFSMPSILMNQWFPIDLGAIFSIGQALDEWLPWILSPHNGSGRYFPVYWLYYCSQVLVFGTDTVYFYAVHSLIFVGIAATTYVVLMKLTRSRAVALVSLLLFYFSTPLAENMNTLGKGEPLAYLLLSIVILITCVKSLSTRNDSTWAGEIASGLVIAVLFCLSIWTKETSLALLGFATTGLVIALFLRHRHPSAPPARLIRTYRNLLVALVVGLALSRIPYFVFPKTTSDATYTSYDITLKLVAENARFYLFQQPDVLAFALIGLIGLAWIGRNLLRDQQRTTHHDMAATVFVASLYAMAAAYYLVLLVWRWPMPYYMLLPAVVFKACAIYCVAMYVRRADARNWLKYSAYGVIALCTVYGALCTYYVAGSMISYSQMYTQAMQEADRFVSADTRKRPLVIESYPFFAEQVGLQLDKGQGWEVHGAKGIADVLDPDTTSNTDLLKLLRVTDLQITQNRVNLPSRGDYVLTFTGNKLAHWFVRGVTPYFLEDSLLKTLGMYDMELVSEDKITLPAIFVHTWTHRPTIEDNTYLGYKLYRVLNERPKFVWGNRFPDGWVSKKSTLRVNREYGRPVVLKISSPVFSLPNRLTIRRDGVLVEEVEFTDTNQKIVNLGSIDNDSTEFEFEVARVVVPRDLGINRDKRTIGLLVDLDRTAE